MLRRFPTFSQGLTPRVSLLAALCLLPLIAACGSEDNTLPPPDTSPTDPTPDADGSVESDSGDAPDLHEVPDAALDCESIETRLWPNVGECHPRCQWEVIGYPVDLERSCIRREPVRVACSPAETIAIAVTCYDVPGLGYVVTGHTYPSLPFTRSHHGGSCPWNADYCPTDGSD